MKREDANGFWEIEDNPISCAGVYPYLGAHLPGAPDPTKVYRVFRPPEELGKPETVNSFKLQPWVITHAMLGPKEKGLTPPEEKGIHGVIGEKVYFDGNAVPPTLYANIKVFSEALKGETEHGAKELSVGYFHDVEWKSGAWNGQPYDAVQRNISGNHLASVEDGRMGPGVAVMDGALRGFDPNPFTLKFYTLEDSLMTLEELFEMLKGIGERLKALEGAKTGAAAGADTAGAAGQEKGSAAGSDNGNAAGKDNAGATGNDNGNAAGKDTAGETGSDKGNAAGKDEEGANADLSLEALTEAMKAIVDRLERLEGDGGASADNADKNSTAAGKDETGAALGKKEDEKSSGASMDAVMIQKKILRDIAGRDALVTALLPRTGTFDHSLMTEQEVAAYGCNKLGVPYSRGQESVAIRAYLKGAATASAAVFSMDSAYAAPAGGNKSSKMKNYLAEGK